MFVKGMHLKYDTKQHLYGRELENIEINPHICALHIQMCNTFPIMYMEIHTQNL